MDGEILIGAFVLHRDEHFVTGPDGPLRKLTDAHVRVLETLAVAKLSGTPWLKADTIAHAAGVSPTSIGNCIAALRNAFGEEGIFNKAGYGYSLDLPVMWPSEAKAGGGTNRPAGEDARLGKTNIGDPTASGSRPQVIDQRHWRLYHLDAQTAEALRLVGASDEFFPPDTVHVEIDPSPYRIPPEILLQRDAILADLERHAKENGQMFFDGPHTRLIRMRVNPSGQREQKHLDLTLGPVGWFDFSVMNEVIAQKLFQTSSPSLKHYIDLDEVADGNFNNVRLTNILGATVTILTLDEQALYSRRSSRLSAGGGLLSGTVNENIHQTLDRSLDPTLPGEQPAPFRAALRGIEEEISPEIRRALKPEALLMTGVAFNLRNLQPDALFALAAPYTAEELIDIAKRRPGKDFIEGKLQSVSIRPGDADLSKLLADGSWLAGGKACFMRALEFLYAVQQRRGASRSEIIQRWCAGETAWLGGA